MYNIFIISWKGDAFAQYRLIEKLSKGKVICDKKIGIDRDSGFFILGSVLVNLD